MLLFKMQTCIKVYGIFLLKQLLKKGIERLCGKWYKYKGLKNECLKCEILT